MRWFEDDDLVWKLSLGVIGVAVVGGIVYAVTRDEPAPTVTASGGWGAPAAPAVVQERRDDGFWSGYWWGRAMHSTPTVVHHETEVHHVYHPAPSYTPAPVVRFTPAPVRVSAIKTVSSPARSMSTSSFRSGGRR